MTQQARRRFRVGGFTQGSGYVVRAELPSPDPGKDIEIKVDGGRLTIHAEQVARAEPHRCQFRYGAFTQTVVLPRGADLQRMTVSYNNGVLEIAVPVPRAKTGADRLSPRSDINLETAWRASAYPDRGPARDDRVKLYAQRS